MKQLSCSYIVFSLVILSMILTSILNLSAQNTSKDVEISKSTYPQLIEKIQANKGKVILVDFWGEFCLPCKKKFPQFVQLGKRYLSRGLKTISVSLDDTQDNEALSRVKDFLQSQNGTGENLILQEKVEFWQKKLKTVGPPAIYLFNQNGRLINRWVGEEIDFFRIERRIQDLLSQ